MDDHRLPSVAEALELQAGRLQRLLGDYLLVSQPQGWADGPSGRQALALICELYGFASWEAFLKLSPRPQTDDLRAVPGRLGAAISAQFGLNLGEAQLSKLLDELVLGFESVRGAQVRDEAMEEAQARYDERQQNPQGGPAALILSEALTQRLLRLESGTDSAAMLQALTGAAVLSWEALPADPSLLISQGFLDGLGELAFGPGEELAAQEYTFALQFAAEGPAPLLAAGGMTDVLGDTAGGGPDGVRVLPSGSEVGGDPRELLVAAAQGIVLSDLPTSAPIGEWILYTIDRCGEPLLAWLLRRVIRRHGVTVVRVHSAEQRPALLGLWLIPAGFPLPPEVAAAPEEELSGLRELLWKIGFWDHDADHDSPEREAYRLTITAQTPHPGQSAERIFDVLMKDDRSEESAADIARALLLSRASLAEAGLGEVEISAHPLVRELLADLLRAELNSGGYRIDELDPAHLAEDPDFGPGYSVWFGTRFEVAYSVTGAGLKLVSHPQGMSAGGRTHLAEAEARVIALLS